MSKATQLQESSDEQQIPPEIEAKQELLGDFEFEGVDNNPQMGEDSAKPVGPIYYWGNGERKIGVFRNDEYDDDGYPYTTCKWIVPFDGGEPYWKHTHIAETWKTAIRAAECNSDLLTFYKDSNKGETYTEWVDRTGGTGYEPSTHIDQ